ncbi:MAG: TRAP transporter large permease subunit [Rhizobiales bacterium]|nr:TRAP transporter large permease subunit [Hyphomicrobiales bacterium]
MELPPLLVVIGLLVMLLFIGSPVIFAIGAAGLAYFLIAPGMIDQLPIFAHKFFTGMDVFIWLSIPLFVFSGEVMGAIGMTDRLVRFSRLLVGWLRGGHGYVNVVGSMMFGGVSGSALADISALGPIEIRLMKQAGYRADFSTALTVTSAIQGPIIPPSIPLIIFASLTNTSVAALYLGGVIPGLLIGIAQMVVVFIMTRVYGFPKNPIEGLTFAMALRIVIDATLAIMMPVIILGGILSGAFTPTEAAAVAVAYALMVGFLAYRTLTFARLWELLGKVARTSASIYLIVGFATVLGWVFAAERVPTAIQGLVDHYQLAPWMFLLAVNIFLLINGLFVSDSVQLLLFAPLFTPIAVTLGIDPVHFGVIMTVNVMIGLITPPYGLGLYLGSIVGGVPLGALVRATLPFLASAIAMLMLVTYVPETVLALPRYFGFL